MAIKFNEIKRYLARNIRLSICFEDGYYHDYLIVSDIPAHKYDNLYLYGIGMVDVEFSRDLYSEPQELEGVIQSSKDDELKPAIEIVLHKESREVERVVDASLLFKDLKPFLQIGRNFTIQNREDWSGEEYEYKSDIPEKYDDMYVYGIGMDDNFSKDEMVDHIYREHDTVLKKRMVIVLSNKPRSDIADACFREVKSDEIKKRKF